MKTIHQFTMNRQFFKIILDLVHTRYQNFSETATPRELKFLGMIPLEIRKV